MIRAENTPSSRSGIHIDAGVYPVYEHLVIRLPEPVDFPPGSRTALTGDNGLGKTSFLREILSPRILEAREREGLLLCWLDQDFLPQCHTVRAWMAARGRALSDGRDALPPEAWSEADAALRALAGGLAEAARCQGRGIFLVSDETGIFASLPPVINLLDGISLTLVVVSHGPLPLSGHFRRLLFSRDSPDPGSGRPEIRTVVRLTS